MKNYTKSKKFVVIIGYLLSIVMLVYFCYLMGTFVREITLYEAEIGKVSFGEKFGYAMGNIGALVQAVTLALLTKLYAIVAPNKKSDKEPKHVARHSKNGPQDIRELYEDLEKPVYTRPLTPEEKDDITAALKKAYDKQSVEEPSVSKKQISKSKTMSLKEASDKIGVSKDRVYRYCKSSGICDNHKDESPIMITEAEFKAVKNHFEGK